MYKRILKIEHTPSRKLSGWDYISCYCCEISTWKITTHLFWRGEGTWARPIFHFAESCHVGKQSRHACGLPSSPRVWRSWVLCIISIGQLSNQGGHGSPHRGIATFLGRNEETSGPRTKTRHPPVHQHLPQTQRPVQRLSPLGRWGEFWVSTSSQGSFRRPGALEWSRSTQL